MFANYSTLKRQGAILKSRKKGIADKVISPEEMKEIAP
jgi:hypothetical protein